MAKRKQTRKSKPTTPGLLQRFAEIVSRPEGVGLALVLIAVFTLLSLLTDSRGSLTGAWIDLLENGFGVGMWLFPLVCGALGLWLVVQAVERMPNMPWQRPAGLLLLFLGALIVATLTLPAEQGKAGGWLGEQIVTALTDTTSRGVVWAFVTLLLIAGIIFLTDSMLADTAVDSWYSIQEWWARRGHDQNTASIHPELPLPSGKIPWWKRRLDGWQRPQQQPILDIGDEKMVVPSAPSSGSGPQQERAPSPSHDRQRGGEQKPQGTDDPLLTPRIVGGSKDWQLPEIGNILNDWERHADSDERIREQGRLIQDTLALFGVPADFEGAYKGPAVTQYLIRPGYIERVIRGESKRVKVKVSKIAGLSNDLALALAAPSVRIEAPIPGTNYVGVEVPNQESNVVGLKELMESEVFGGGSGRLRIALGEDVKGQPIVTELAKMPHLLIAGATGSGKSVCINSIITCLLLTHTPDNLRMLMIDPKMVELSVFNGIPHLLSPVVTEIDRAAGVLFWAVKEMERRYQLLSNANTRDLERFNNYLTKRGESPLPYIVVIVDEMADLMMAAPEEVEKHVCRLAQMARAVGIHLIIATQRPSVDVITGLIKANFPARIAFAVTSQTDSRVILDVPGAERLLGRGDMLFMSPDASKLERIQGTWLSDDEINNVIRYWKGIRSLDTPPPALHTPDMRIEERQLSRPASPMAAGDVEETTHGAPYDGATQVPLFEEIEALKSADSRDALFDEAVRVVGEAGRGSVSLLQRRLRIGYSRASRLVDQLEEAAILGPDRGGSLGREYLGANGDDEQREGPKPRTIGESDDESTSTPRIWM